MLSDVHNVFSKVPRKKVEKTKATEAKNHYKYIDSQKEKHTNHWSHWINAAEGEEGNWEQRTWSWGDFGSGLFVELRRGRFAVQLPSLSESWPDEDVFEVEGGGGRRFSPFWPLCLVTIAILPPMMPDDWSLMVWKDKPKKTQSANISTVHVKRYICTHTRAEEINDQLIN